MRRGSGGAGRFRGGDGVVRELEALEPMRYSLITERRRHAPQGADGGEPGARGRNLLNGEELPPKASGELARGDRLRLETPGGGGWLGRWRATLIGTVAFLGIGIMGAPMAANLASAGFEVVVWNRTREKAEALAASTAPSPTARPPRRRPRDGIVISMVPDAPEVEAVLLGPRAEGLGQDALAIDMSTIGPTA